MYIEKERKLENASDERMQDKWQVKVIVRKKGGRNIKTIYKNRNKTA